MTEENIKLLNRAHSLYTRRYMYKMLDERKEIINNKMAMIEQRENETQRLDELERLLESKGETLETFTKQKTLSKPVRR